MRISLWNANSLAQHKFELELFLKQQQIDVMLISETHFTDKNYLKINGYNIYYTNILVERPTVAPESISKHLASRVCMIPERIPPSQVPIEDCHGTIPTLAVYCPPTRLLKRTSTASLTP